MAEKEAPQNVFGDDSEGFVSGDKGINYKRVEKAVGIFDPDNPPEGVVFIGKPLPDAVAEGLWLNFSLPPIPRRRRNLM